MLECSIIIIIIMHMTRPGDPAAIKCFEQESRFISVGCEITTTPPLLCHGLSHLATMRGKYSDNNTNNTNKILNPSLKNVSRTLRYPSLFLPCLK
jgi:hypothetical protein